MSHQFKRKSLLIGITTIVLVVISFMAVDLYRSDIEYMFEELFYADLKAKNCQSEYLLAEKLKNKRGLDEVRVRMEEKDLCEVTFIKWPNTITQLVLDENRISAVTSYGSNYELKSEVLNSEAIALNLQRLKSSDSSDNQFIFDIIKVKKDDSKTEIIDYYLDQVLEYSLVSNQ